MKVVEEYIDFENSIGPWLGKTSKIVDYYLHELLLKHGLDLSKEQMITLKKLHDKDGLNQNELAFLTFRDKSSLARLLSKMEKKNYIQRKQSKEDKRINEVFLTSKGKAVFKQSKPAIREFIATMEHNITSEERKHMINILKKIQFNFTQEEVAL
ncbi:MAG: MarR family transcriptional regulator [Maribacter sp.]|nr:MarR family transcriptional regulator [Maribacter sp.]